MPFQKGHKPYNKKAAETEGSAQTEAPKPVLKRTLLRDRLALSYDGKDPDLVYRVFNDKDGRVEDAKKAGWSPVRDGTLGNDAGSPDAARQPGGAVTRHVGSGITGVLMCKPKGLEEEDLSPLEVRNQNIEESIFGEIDQQDRYGEIKVGERRHARRA